MAHKDKYEDFAHLNAEQTEGLAFRVCATHRGSRLAIIAPHGGKIEPHTSEVASSIARDDFDLYCFEGLLPTGNFKILHITSTNFDEPRCLGLIRGCDIVVSIHGLGEEGDVIYVGGLDITLRDTIRESLEFAGFDARTDESAAHSAKNPLNICNKGFRRRGVQLEIENRLREALAESEDRLRRFSDAVRKSITERVGAL